MESHLNQHGVDNDPLEQPFQQDAVFRRFLKNRTFNDYLNTFLSLPVFAVRVLYRRDIDVFELEQPISRTQHHFIKENVLTWVRVNRGPMFLKTTICNEYRFCATLLKLPVCLNIDECNSDDVKRFHSKYLAKVIDMQRFKGYMRGSFGESLIAFWLDAERFRRQVPKSCRRFVLKEIYAKYLCDGAVHELTFSVRENIKKNLKSLWEENKIGTSYIKAVVLLTAQNIALQSLQLYWIPKYIYHRLKRRGVIKQRWGKIMALPKVKKIRKKKTKLAELVEELKKKDDSIMQLNATLGKDNTNETTTQSGTDPNPKMKDINSAGGSCTPTTTTPPLSKRTSRRRSLSEGQGGHVRSRRSSLSEENKSSRRESSSEEVEKRKSSSEMLVKCKSSEFSMGKRKLRQQQQQQQQRQQRRKRSVSESESNMLMTTTDGDDHSVVGRSTLWSRIIQRQHAKVEEDEDEDVVVEDELSYNKLITLQTPSIVEMEYNQHNDETLFTPIFPPILAGDEKKKGRKSTFFESLHENPEEHYEADNEDNTKADEPIHLPLLKTLEEASRSFIAPMIQLPRHRTTKIQQPYSKSFVHKNTLSVLADEDHMFNVLLAALMTDQVAGQPLLEYFRETDKKVAESNLKFWTASNDILTDSRCNDPVVRQQQYHTLIHLHLSQFSGSHLSLPDSHREELCELLPKDVAVTKLMEATNSVAMQLMPEWDEFLKYDRRTFLRSTTHRRRKTSAFNQDSILAQFGPPMSNMKKEVLLRADNLRSGHHDDEFDGTFPDILDPVQQRDTDACAFNSRRMWRAMELAISICKPKHTDVLDDAKENEKWTTDESDSDVHDSDDEETTPEGTRHRDERIAGSLAINSLEYLHKKQQRLKKLEDLFNKRHQSLAHEYLGVNLLKHVTQDTDHSAEEDLKPAFLEHARRETISHVKPPRPRCFQDVLTDPIQYEHFKRFLTKEKEETPLLFWTAVESMRTTSRSAKARQGRTHGIVKRYFGPSAMHGKELKCNADIIKEIPFMEKVTPAMLVSAQACVSKTMEEAWFAKYLLTFQDQGGLTGVTLLPIYGTPGTTNETVRSVKNKTRGLWRMFTKNVISFRRGIMTNETLVGFQEFLELEHQLNLDQSNANNQTELGLPPRVVINNKLIHTEKLQPDLNFWSEVERYKDFADAVVLCAKLGNYTKDDELVVVKKAKTIVDCFIDSQIPPRVQINISNDLAENVIQLVQNGIIERGLFHEAALSTFSTLIFFWKKFCLHRFLPIEKKPMARKVLRCDRSAQVLAKQKVLKSNKAKRVALSLDEDCTKLMFSLQLGLRLGVQKSLVKRRLGNLSECEGDVRRESVMDAEESPTVMNNNRPQPLELK